MKNRPYFLWDYDLDENDVRRILRGKNLWEKRWLMARILSSANFRDVWQYLSLEQITKEMPYLKMRSSIKNAWKRTLNVWKND